MKFVWIALGGALGALTRYAVSEWCQQRFPMRFPIGTFLINISGCLLIGFVVTLLDTRLPGPSPWRYAIPIGFIGAYTTFSTFELEIFRATQAHWGLIALGYLASSVILGFAGVWCGVLLGGAVSRLIA